MNRWAGPLLALLILGGVAGVLLLNLDPQGIPTGSPTPPPAVAPASSNETVPGSRPPDPPAAGSGATVAPFREYPIGEVQRENLEIAAVWLPAIHMDQQEPRLGTSTIHLEADIHALANHPNGFGLGEFVPYLTIHYTIQPKAGGEPITGTLTPMIARDGLHYGVSLATPPAGDYVLTYRIEPPSSGGLGRHDDPVTGVAPWWSPFEVAFDWHFDPALLSTPANGATP